MDSKLPAHHSGKRPFPLGIFLGLAALILVLVLVSFEFGCLVPAGTAIKSREGIAAGKRWEVWLRKNKDSGEPFAAGLFIEQAPEVWYTCLLDFETIRSVGYTVRPQGTNFVVLEGSSPFATLDSELRHFQRIGRDEPEAATVTQGQPPGRWWR